MRAVLAIAILAAVAVAGATAAEAADVRLGQRGAYTVHYHPVGRRAPALTVFDYEPGVVTRAYWLPPWRHRHYFPFRLASWERHRHHAAGRPRPAAAFRRYWTTSYLYADPGPDDVIVERIPLPPRDWRRRRIP